MPSAGFRTTWLLMIGTAQPKNISLEKQIESKLSGIDELPSLPVVATKVMELMRNRNVDLKEISRVIVNDPA